MIWVCRYLHCLEATNEDMMVNYIQKRKVGLVAKALMWVAIYFILYGYLFLVIFDSWRISLNAVVLLVDAIVFVGLLSLDWMANRWPSGSGFAYLYGAIIVVSIFVVYFISGRLLTGVNAVAVYRGGWLFMLASIGVLGKWLRDRSKAV